MPTTQTLTAASLLLAATALASAQQGQPAETTPDQRPPAELADTKPAPVFEINLGARHYFESDMDTAPGNLTTSRANLGASMTLLPAEGTRLTFSVEATESWYDFNNATSLDASGDPFDNATEVDLAAAFSAPLNGTTSYFIAAQVGYAAESGADFGDSIVYGGAIGFVTKESDTFSWGLGIAVRSRLEDDALIIPLPQITWKLSDRWTLATERGGVSLDYRATDALSYGLAAQFDSRTFRLDETGPIPAGVATEQRVPVSFYATYNPDKNISITAEVGATVYSNIELFDAAGNDLTDDDIDPAVFLGLTARIRF